MAALKPRRPAPRFSALQAVERVCFCCDTKRRSSAFPSNSSGMRTPNLFFEKSITRRVAMRRRFIRTASANLTRVLCLAGTICSVGVTLASAQGPCIWDEVFGVWKCPGNKNAAPTAYWTAIAYSNSTMSSGASHGQPTQSAAESVAKTNCSYLASDCQPFLSRSNLCLALATSPSERAMGWATDPDRYKAAEAALAACRKYKGTLCQIQAAQCGSNDPDPASGAGLAPPTVWIQSWAAFNGLMEARYSQLTCGFVLFLCMCM